MWFLAFLVLFYFSYGEEGVIIEKRNGYYHVENYKFSTKSGAKQSKKSKKTARKLNKKEAYYLSSKKGRVFHRPSCRFAKRIKHKVKYSTKREALNKGLRPCSVCKP